MAIPINSNTTVQSGVTLSATGTGLITATGLESATTTVSVSGAAAPTLGQVLTCSVAGTTATWQTPSAQAFSAITAGTNATALVIGTGGSLTVSGTGSITATHCPYSGLTGTVPTWNQSTTGNAATAYNLFGSAILPYGTAATTQPPYDNSNILATTAYTDAAVSVEFFRASAAEGLLAPLASPAFTGIVTGVTATMVGLGNVTNDAQTKAAIMPNTAPAAGKIPIGNAGGTAYAPVALTGPVTVTSAGVTSVATLNQSTTGTAANLSGTPTLPNGTAATTQGLGDGSTKLATTNYCDDQTLNFPGGWSYRNRLINGAMRTDQRNSGASQTITASAFTYTVDRWFAYSTGANATGQQVAGSAGFPYAYKITGAASVSSIGFLQRIESSNIADLASTTVSLQVLIASSSLTSITWEACYPTTTDSYGTFSSPSKTVITSGIFTITSTLSSYSTTIALPAGAAKGLEISFTAGALGAAATVTITGAQLEASSQSTTFERLPISLELAECQRYYQTQAYLNPISCVSYTSNGDTRNNFPFPVTMRTTPTVTLSTYSWSIVGFGCINSALNVANYCVNQTLVVQVQGTNTNGFYIYFNTGSSYNLNALGTVAVWGSSTAFSYYASAEL